MKSLLKKIIFQVCGPIKYEKVIGLKNLGYIPSLKKPKKFNEKISRRKFQSDRKRIATLSNKILVRSYVADKIGESHLTILHGVFSSEITPEAYKDLPEKFVLKSARGSGANKFFDKKIDSINVFNKFVKYNLNKEYLSTNNEVHYNDTRDYIFAESLLEDKKYGVPYDYKFFVFDGKVKYIQVDMDRFKNHTRTFYDENWNKQPFSLKFPIGKAISRPALLTEMIAKAELLADGFDFVRVDLYNVNDKIIVFGELTFMPGSGREKFTPAVWDKHLGDLWPETTL